MASLPKTGTVTYKEWLRLPVTEGRDEAVNGEIQIMPPAKWKHALIVERLRAALHAQVDTRRVIVGAASFGLVIRKQHLTRAPDLAVFELRSIVEQDGYIHSAPQLLVEVWSPGVEVFYLVDGALRQSQILTAGILKPKHFPGVQIDIAGIWPD
jgi:Uma2 family endonuclease